MTNNSTEIRPGNYLLAQDEVLVLKQANQDSEASGKISKGENLYVIRRATIDNVEWLRVSDEKGNEGYIKADTFLQPAPIKRFIIERVVFIAIISIVVAICITAFTTPGQNEITSPIGRFFATALFIPVAITGVLICAQLLFGMDPFHEIISPETPQEFSWRRLAQEPVRVGFWLILVLAFTLLAALGRAMFR